MDFRHIAAFIVIASFFGSACMGAERPSYERRVCRFGPPVEATIKVCDALLTKAKSPVMRAAILDDRARANRTFGDIKAALNDANKAVQLAPKLARYWVTLGDMQSFNGIVQAAVSTFDKAIALDAASAPAYAGRANAQWLAGQYEAALASAAKANELDPLLAEPDMVRGKIYLIQGDYEKSIAAVTDAIRLKNAESDRMTEQASALKNLDKGKYTPESLEAVWRKVDSNNFHAIRAAAYRELKNYPAAIADFDFALRGFASDSRTFLERGDVHILNGNQEMARADYDQAIANDPKFAEAFYSRGTLFLDRKQYDLAMADYDKAIALQPNYPAALLNRASIWVYREDWSKAVDGFGQAIAAWPQFGLAFGNRAYAYEKMGAYDLALADFARAIALEPDDSGNYFNRSVVYAITNKFALALADLDIAIAKNPDAPMSYNNRCYTRILAKGDLNLAEADCAKGLSLDRNAFLLNSSGFLKLAQGKYALALANYAGALGLEPDNASSLFGRGFAKIKLGQKKVGQMDIDLAMKRDPTVAKDFVLVGYK